MSNAKLKRKGYAIIISGPSGSGKTSLTRMLLKELTNLELSVSITTRYQREGEIEGKDYYFTNEKHFLKMLESGEILEYTKLYGNFYGTIKEKVINKFNKGIDILFDVDSVGAKSLKTELKEDAVSIFILPPSFQELKKRLISRGQETDSIIQKRLIAAKSEINKVKNYDYVIYNDELLTAYENIKNIVIGEKNKRHRILNLESYINNFNSVS